MRAMGAILLVIPLSGCAVYRSPGQRMRDEIVDRHAEDRASYAVGLLKFVSGQPRLPQEPRRASENP
jgi:hypothetical protein